MSHTPKIPGIQNGVTTIQTNVSTLQTDVSTLETDISTLETDISTLETDISTLETDISTLQTGGGEGGSGSTETFTNTYSISMDGTNDYGDAGVVSALQNASAFSVSVWFKKGAASEWPAFGGYTSGSDNVSAHGWENNIWFNVRNGVETRYVVTSSNLPTDTTSFHHYVYTFDGGTFKVYVDGIERSGTVYNSGTTSTGTANFSFKIGYMGFHYDQGLYDELAIFSSALSSSDVTAIYNSGTPASLSSYSPVAWWRMEEGSGTTVVNTANSGTNDVTLYNGPTFSTDVPEAPEIANSYSLNFDGTNDYVSVTQDSAINISGDITLSAWIYRTKTTSYNAIFTKRQVGGSMNYQFTINNSNGRIGLGHSGNSWVYNTTTTLATGTWYHVAVTVSSGTAQFYVNGVSEDSFTGISINATTQDLIIGATLGYNYFDGNIDEAAIFNSALSSSDITSIYNSGTPGNISSLNPVGWWRMGDNDSGTGTAITDQGSGGNNGTLINGTAFSFSVPS